MNILKNTLVVIFAFVAIAAKGQEKYWVYFTDKNGVEFDPYQYFDEKAIERRMHHEIPPDHYTDRPVRQDYVQAVQREVDSLKMVSRWFNAAVVYADKTQITTLKTFPFVRQVKQTHYKAVPAATNMSLNGADDALARAQVARLGLEKFEAAGIDGSGIRVAIFDAGFPDVDEDPAFEHIRNDNRIIKTYDFVRNKENVYKSSAHGTSVLSCIAGKVGGQKLGLATGAEFLLARTEMAWLEPFAEEENWLAAAEWADKNGAMIINSSLGYTKQRYFNEDMNGKNSLVARAANMAASKGMLVVNAAGNDGSKDWKFIGTPADADSVLSVAGIDPYSNYHIGFSSYGPTADGRIKPNVAAYGNVVAINKKGIHTTFGTSFASPLIAGFAACAWQTAKELKNMELFDAIQRSAELYPYYDYAHGYGVPRAGYFTGDTSATEKTFDLIEEEYAVQITIKEAFFEKNEKHQENEIVTDDYLYYHIQNPDGKLHQYFVMKVTRPDVLSLYKEDFRKGQVIRVHYKGYTETWQF